MYLAGSQALEGVNWDIEGLSSLDKWSVCAYLFTWCRSAKCEALETSVDEAELHLRLKTRRPHLGRLDDVWAPRRERSREFYYREED